MHTKYICRKVCGFHEVWSYPSCEGIQRGVWGWWLSTIHILALFLGVPLRSVITSGAWWAWNVACSFLNVKKWAKDYYHGNEVTYTYFVSALIQSGETMEAAVSCTEGGVLGWYRWSCRKVPGTSILFASYLFVVLICITRKSNEIEHLSICVYAIFISALRK